jgi:hypothetical protein
MDEVKASAYKQDGCATAQLFSPTRLINLFSSTYSLHLTVRRTRPYNQEIIFSQLYQL